ncbi:MAG: Secretory immunoglobulin A-binding protein EsiB [Paracidovorax wautersii]|uniref:Secretory immunoglobulin A-binding protein EsiB n=1 Tax=Paracidovorax wautersii TaxID=1177982 RepID=A0A7V8JR07_9BURK|nr:MAG: Secretory immunoglobulin A-binding protein EsiB [Paracidovorax wautersii]
MCIATRSRLPATLLLLAALAGPLAGHAGATPAAQSLTTLESATQQGQARSDYELARYFSGATGDRIDPPRAMHHLKRAAEGGLTQAQVDLAFVHYNGQGAQGRDYAQSFHWFKRAADAGSGIAQCMLGDFYREGWGGTPRNPREAVRLYRLTAAAPLPCASRSQYQLYLSHTQGLGVEQNIPVAMQWLRKAARAGNPQAQRTLGIAYLRGQGVPPDLERADHWLRLSRQGVAPHDDHEHDDPAHDGLDGDHRH